MKGRKTTVAMIVLVSVLLAGAVALNGCKKKSERATPEKTKDVTPVTGEQTICPVMAGPINKDIYAEYEGKKVYFCCQGCVDKFKANPQEYIGKLPQFKD